MANVINMTQYLRWRRLTAGGLALKDVQKFRHMDQRTRLMGLLNKARDVFRRRPTAHNWARFLTLAKRWGES